MSEEIIGNIIIPMDFGTDVFDDSTETEVPRESSMKNLLRQYGPAGVTLLLSMLSGAPNAANANAYNCSLYGKNGTRIEWAIANSKRNRFGEYQTDDEHDDSTEGVTIPFFGSSHILNLLQRAESKFKYQLENLQQQEDRKAICNYLPKINAKFIATNLPIDKLFLSITSAKSLFYRFGNEKVQSEFKLQIFYLHEKEDDDGVEAILHIYQNGTQIASHLGSMNEMFDIINEKLNDLNEHSTAGVSA